LFDDLNFVAGCKGYRFRFPELIPANGSPFQAGTDGGRSVYPCSAYAEGSIIPGKGILSPSPACWLPYGGREIGMSSGFEILTNPAGGGNLEWIPRVAGNITRVIV